jgi:hypothetical protein
MLIGEVLAMALKWLDLGFGGQTEMFCNVLFMFSSCFCFLDLLFMVCPCFCTYVLAVLPFADLFFSCFFRLLFCVIVSFVIEFARLHFSLGFREIQGMEVEATTAVNWRVLALEREALGKQIFPLRKYKGRTFDVALQGMKKRRKIYRSFV